jgi:hypothetical protein
VIEPGLATFPFLFAGMAWVISIDDGWVMSDRTRGRWDMLFAIMFTVAVAILVGAVFSHLDIRTR